MRRFVEIMLTPLWLPIWLWAVLRDTVARMMGRRTDGEDDPDDEDPDDASAR